MKHLSPFEQPAPEPEASHPGRCQACGTFGITWEYWPSTLPARYADLCEDCLALGDLEIARRLTGWRRDGAVV